MANKQLAWIGLGNMGRGMVSNLATKGNLTSPLIVYNRSKQRSDDLNAKLSSALTVASTIPEAVTPADIIFSCIGDDKSVTDTFAEILKLDVKGKLFVESSTIHPDTTASLEKLVLAQGARFLAMPVFGAPAMADAGQLICVPSGPAEDVDVIRPYLVGVIGKAIVDFSNQPPSKALLLKLIGNTFVLSMVETLAEAHVLAEKTGLGTDLLHKFVEAMFPGPYTAYSNRMISGDYHKREEPLFAVDLARKDANHALALAKASGTELKIPALVDEHLKVVKEVKGEKGDIAGLYGAVRVKSGLEYDN